MLKQPDSKAIFAAVLVVVILVGLYRSQQVANDFVASADEYQLDKGTRTKVDAGHDRIALIGAAGNIGLQLLQDLGQECTGFDRDPHELQVGVNKGAAELAARGMVTLSSDNMNRELLHKFRTVVFLGGCTGRRTCADLQPHEIYQEMVQTVLDLVARMGPHQHLILASTSAIAEGSGSSRITETAELHTENYDQYTQAMLSREIEVKRISGASAPCISMLRFGTVIGVSPGQRTDLLVPSLFKAAYTTGTLQVAGGASMRSFLWLQDLSRAVQTLVRASNDDLPDFSIYHLSSFDASVGEVAKAVASLTGTQIEEKQGPSSAGFSLDSSKFANKFNFKFEGTLAIVLDEMNENVPDSITAKGAHEAFGTKVPQEVGPGKDTIPCPVCGSYHLQEALDLYEQPFANDFRPTAAEAMKSAKFPLKLIRCKHCNHLYLSQIADRGELFSDYLYQSGTSKTLGLYFKWLAEKVFAETGSDPSGSVLELACNDGSQLDHFAKLGWKTFGVDPAANLVPLATKKGHNVKVGFWGTELEFPELPAGRLSAIVAQNVFAHVPSPVAFLKACARVMGPQTKLYIQTSQCQMHFEGQFDTAYHEHISFFTGHSFHKAAQLAGLYITDFELTPIHGTSCLVTFMLPTETTAVGHVSSGLEARLSFERKELIPLDFFYLKYEAHAHSIRGWVSSQLSKMHKEGYILGAFGAAAKGMVLLHFMLHQPDPGFEISFVVDDAPLKQDTYCPGTTIPVWPTNKIKEVDPKKKLGMIIFAWNFWEEIEKNLRRELKDIREEITVITPFPSPKLLRVPMQQPTEVLLEHPYSPVPIPQN